MEKTVKFSTRVLTDTMFFIPTVAAQETRTATIVRFAFMHSVCRVEISKNRKSQSVNVF